MDDYSLLASLFTAERCELLIPRGTFGLTGDRDADGHLRIEYLIVARKDANHAGWREPGFTIRTRHPFTDRNRLPCLRDGRVESRAALPTRDSPQFFFSGESSGKHNRSQVSSLGCSQCYILPVLKWSQPGSSPGCVLIHLLSSGVISYTCHFISAFRTRINCKILQLVPPHAARDFFRLGIRNEGTASRLPCLSMADRQLWQRNPSPNGSSFVRTPQIAHRTAEPATSFGRCRSIRDAISRSANVCPLCSDIHDSPIPNSLQLGEFQAVSCPNWQRCQWNPAPTEEILSCHHPFPHNFQTPRTWNFRYECVTGQRAFPSSRPIKKTPPSPCLVGSGGR